MATPMVKAARSTEIKTARRSGPFLLQPWFDQLTETALHAAATAL